MILFLKIMTQILQLEGQWLFKMDLAIISAVSENDVIGYKGNLPWKIDEDMKRFKELTLGKPVIMGRKTYESIPEKFRPLPHRPNIVLTSQQDFQVPDRVDVVHSKEAAIEKAESYNNLAYIIGGESVYREFLPLANRIEITCVHKEVEGDAFFPKINWDDWEETKREDFEKYSFLTYERK